MTDPRNYLDRSLEMIRRPPFEGICIGGPRAGQSMSHNEPRVRFPDYGHAAAKAEIRHVLGV